jgi:hypothetical protein
MTETVLVMPFMFVVLSLLLFLGWGMERMHRAVLIDRYDAWRQAAMAPGPHREGPQHGQFNSTFFHNNAEEVDAVPAEQPTFDVPRYWEQVVGQGNGRAGQFVEEAHGDLPMIRQSRFKTTHSTNIPFWNKINGDKAIDHQHTRLGHDWRFVNHVLEYEGDHDQRWFSASARTWRTLRKRPDAARPTVPTLLRTEAMKDTYFQPLDDQVQPVARRGNGLGRTWRALYMAHPAYYGPRLPEEWVDNYNRAQSASGGGL